MIDLNELTGREARTMNPRTELLCEVVEHLVSLGWKFKVSSVCPAYVKNPYAWGWWFNPDCDRKPLPAGDAGNFHLKAWDAFTAYVAR